MLFYHYLKVDEMNLHNPEHLKVKDDFDAGKSLSENSMNPQLGNSSFSFGIIEILVKEKEELIPKSDSPNNLTVTVANTMSLLINPTLGDFNESSYLILMIDSFLNDSSNMCFCFSSCKYF